MENSKLLLALTEYEARQIIQKSLGRTPETTTKQIRKQTTNSTCSLTKLLEHLNELKEINGDREMEESIPVARAIYTPSYFNS